MHTAHCIRLTLQRPNAVRLSVSVRSMMIVTTSSSSSSSGGGGDAGDATDVRTRRY